STFRALDPSVDFARLFRGAKVLRNHLSKPRLSYGSFSRLKLERLQEFRMPRHEFLDLRRRTGLANGTGHIYREKVARIDELIDGFQVDVVSIDKIASIPFRLTNRHLSRR